MLAPTCGTFRFNHEMVWRDPLQPDILATMADHLVEMHVPDEDRVPRGPKRRLVRKAVGYVVRSFQRRCAIDAIQLLATA